jgi:predicted TIM-barrel fold metal-dependent hydrolase
MDYRFFDADNHYYEAEDCFLRHADEKVKKHVRWVSEGKRRFIVFGNSIPEAIPNATFDPVMKPGSYHARLKMLERGERPPPPGPGERADGLVAISAAYRDRDVRLATMDAQGVDKVFLFPTLGQSVEPMVADEPDMMYRVFRAFNDWLQDDWGFDRDGRMYAPPVVPMMEIDHAVQELDRVLDMGARALCLRPGPVYGRSPVDPYFDPFWARIREAGALVLFHALGGPVPYPAGFKAMWTRPTDDREHMATLEATLFPFERPAMDTLTALILGNFFGRFPGIKVGIIEHGGAWVPYLMHSLDHAGGVFERRVTAFGVPLPDKPSEIMKQNVWVAPFPEEDVKELVDALGVDHVLMGSDWPHAEGVSAPADFLDCLDGLADDEIRKITRENALTLVS